VEQAEVGPELAFDENAWRVLRPREVGFVSYPYEWAFGQLKDAALLTLELQAEALRAGMTLKDASAFNVVFEGGKPVMIDALSFERRAADAPWVAYRQFCQHFLAPLALMASRDVRLGVLSRDFIDGIPLDLAAHLLPGTSRLNMGLGMHIHMHSRGQSKPGDGGSTSSSTAKVSTGRLEALIDSLRRSIEGLRWDPPKTGWSAYGETTSYTAAAAASKKALVERLLANTSGEVVWDLGANTGAFSFLAADAGRRVIALDYEYGAVELLHRELRKRPAASVLPLVVDLSNPSPALGWAHQERRSLADRANADVLIALALVHHLAIGNNVPLGQISSFFARLGRQLIVEFVPKSDPRVEQMLAARKDVFDDYSLDGMKSAFSVEWDLAEELPISDSQRTLLRFERR
jgi:ribosomal protein L11 methylase PrmA